MRFISNIPSSFLSSHCLGVWLVYEVRGSECLGTAHSLGKAIAKYLGCRYYQKKQNLTTTQSTLFVLPWFYFSYIYRNLHGIGVSLFQITGVHGSFVRLSMAVHHRALFLSSFPSRQKSPVNAMAGRTPTPLPLHQEQTSSK